MHLLTPQGPLFTRTETPGTSGERPGRSVVLMLHALGTDMTIWDGLAMQLREVCTVIRVDAPGHGQSPAWPAADVTLHTLAQSVLDVLEQLAPGARVDLVGTSMGAVVALHAASLAPARIRKMVLCGALLIRSSDAATDRAPDGQDAGALVPAAPGWR
jgi:pimeloyl-ACP methyl ester carboxylesterase